MLLASRLRRFAVNSLIAGILCVMLLDALPQAPPTLKVAVQPIARRVGLGQHWNVFSPPDGVNTRLRAEITYRDGKEATWHSPNWREVSLWRRFSRHRHEEWLDTVWGVEDDPVWESWARHLAREMRPGEPEAIRGAEVRLIVAHSYIPLPDFHPWTSWREAPVFDKSDEQTLTILQLP